MPEQWSLDHSIRTNLRKERFTDTYQRRQKNVPKEFLCYQSLTWTYKSCLQAIPQDFFTFPNLLQYLYLYLGIYTFTYSILPYWNHSGNCFYAQATVTSWGPSGLDKFPDHFPVPSNTVTGAITLVELLCSPAVLFVPPFCSHVPPATPNSVFYRLLLSLKWSASKPWKLTYKVSLLDSGVSNH